MSEVSGRRWPSRKSVFLSLFCFGLMALLFQNCGVGFQPGGAIEGSQNFFSASQRMAVTSGSSGYLAGMVSIGKGAIFRLAADPNKLPRNARLLWDNVYSDGMSYCEQTTSIDRLTADFQCMNDGIVTISLTVFSEETEDPELETLTVVVGLPSSVPLPGSGGGGSDPGSATPTPTPPQMSAGATLYLNNCRDCHGDLAISTKRGTTRARLDSAITNVPAMRTLSNLTPQERDLIVQALQ